MNALLRSASIAIAAIAFVGLAQGQGSPRADKARKVPEPRATVELEASSIALPSSTDGMLAMKACTQCPLKSYPVTRATKYYLYSDAVTLAELSGALVGQPQAYVGVTYSQKTGEIMTVRAHARRVR